MTSGCYNSVVSISLFWIDILSSSEDIQFDTKTTRVKSDDKVELGEVLRPPHLPPDQHLGSRKILKVFMICNNINKIS